MPVNLGDLVIAIRARRDLLKQDLTDAEKQVLAFDRSVNRYRDSQGKFVKSATQEVGTFNRALAATNREVGHLNEGFSTIAKTAAGFGLALGVQQIWRFLSGLEQTADRLADVSEGLRTSTGFLAGWEARAARAGISVEKADMALTRLSDKFGDAVRGGEESRKVFQQLGVDVDALAESQASLEEVAAAVNEGIKNQTNAFAQASAIQDMYGRNITRLTPLIMEGKDGIDKIKNSMDEFGVASERNIKAIDDWSDGVANRMRMVQHEAMNAFGWMVRLMTVPQAGSPMAQKQEMERIQQGLGIGQAPPPNGAMFMNLPKATPAFDMANFVPPAERSMLSPKAAAALQESYDKRVEGERRYQELTQELRDIELDRIMADTDAQIKIMEDKYDRQQALAKANKEYEDILRDQAFDRLMEDTDAQIEIMNRVADKQEQITNRRIATFQDIAGGALMDLAVEGESLIDVLENVGKAFLRMMIQAQVAGWGQKLFGGGGIFSPGAGGFGFGTPGGITPDMAALTMHYGGIVGSSAVGSRSVPISAFIGAPRYHGGGIVLGPGEVPIIAEEGEEIIPKGGRGGGRMHVTVRIVGARGSAEIEEAAAQGTARALAGARDMIKAYDMNVLPGRLRAEVPRIADDMRVR